MPNDPNKPDDLPEIPEVPPIPEMNHEELDRIRRAANEALTKAGLKGDSSSPVKEAKFGDLFPGGEKPTKVLRMEDVIEKLDSIKDVLDNISIALTIIAGGRNA